jgi:hypothetical protein
VPRTTPELPLGPLPDLLKWWRKARVKGLIIGGLAAAFLGRPRVTRDVDAIVFAEEDRWPAFLALAKNFHFHSRMPDPLAFARQSRLLLLNRATGIDVDISFAALAFERNALERSMKVRVGRLSVPIPTAEDLIVMKAIANRPIDQTDILHMLDVQKDLDYGYIRKHTDELAAMLDAPGLYEELDVLLQKHAKKQRRTKKSK